MDFTTLSAADAQNLDSIAPGITGIVADEQSSGETWYDALARAIPVIAATVQQKQLLDIQVERARQGLPPLNVSQYAAGAQLGLSSDTKSFLLLAVAGLGAIYLLGKRR